MPQIGDRVTRTAHLSDHPDKRWPAFDGYVRQVCDHFVVVVRRGVPMEQVGGDGGGQLVYTLSLILGLDGWSWTPRRMRCLALPGDTITYDQSAKLAPLESAENE